LARSNTLIVTGNPSPPPVKTPTYITVEATPTSGVVPFDVLVTGSLASPTGPLTAKTVNVYLNGAVVASPRTQVGGVYTATVRIASVGSHSLYAEFPGDAQYEGCEQEGYGWLEVQL